MEDHEYYDADGMDEGLQDFLDADDPMAEYDAQLS